MEVKKYIQMKLKFRIIFSRFHPCIYLCIYIHIQGTYVNLFILKVMTEAPYCLMGKQIKSAFTLSHRNVMKRFYC